MGADEVRFDGDVPEHLGVHAVGHDFHVLVMPVAGLEKEREAVNGDGGVGLEYATLAQCTGHAVLGPRRRAEVGENGDSEQDHETEDQFAHASHCGRRGRGHRAADASSVSEMWESIFCDVVLTCR